MVNNSLYIPNIRDGLSPAEKLILSYVAKHGSATVGAEEMLRILEELTDSIWDIQSELLPKTLLTLVLAETNRYPLLCADTIGGGIEWLEAPLVHQIIGGQVGLTDFGQHIFDPPQNRSQKNELLESESLCPRLPLHLLNGFVGFDFGISCQIPPHNLSELIDCMSAKLIEPHLEANDIRKRIKGPDFPTGGTITSAQEIAALYETGTALITIRTEIAAIESRRSGSYQYKSPHIIIKSLPYLQDQQMFIKRIVDLHMAPPYLGLNEVSGWIQDDGFCITDIQLNRDCNTSEVIESLYKLNILQQAFQFSMLVSSASRASSEITPMNKDAPRCVGLSEMLDEFIEYRLSVLKQNSNDDDEKIREKLLEDLAQLKKSFGDSRRTLISGQGV
jgi:DNA gyrase/topoisomerase IV subunit A